MARHHINKPELVCHRQLVSLEVATSHGSVHSQVTSDSVICAGYFTFCVQTLKYNVLCALLNEHFIVSSYYGRKNKYVDYKYNH